MKNKWNCSICSLTFSRRWNMQRHYESIHGYKGNEFENGQNASLSRMGAKRSVHGIYPPPFPADGIHDSHDTFLDRMMELAKIQNIIANSRQIFDRISFYQQWAIYYERQLNDLYANCWIVSRQAIQGVTGHVCNKCHTFSFKPIMDIGYDITMQSKHHCGQTGNFVVIPIPANIQDTDEWAAKILSDQLRHYMPLMWFVMAKDISKTFSVYGEDTDLRDGIIGIPDRYPFYSLDKYSMPIWIERIIANVSKKIILADYEILDFFRRTKSTYGIFQIPAGDSLKQFFITFVK